MMCFVVVGKRIIIVYDYEFVIGFLFEGYVESNRFKYFIIVIKIIF